MNKRLSCRDVAKPSTGIKLTTALGARSWLALAGLFLAMLAMPALAQKVTIIGQPVRVTLPVGFSGSSNVLCTVTIATNGLTSVDGSGNWVVSPITFSATGNPTTPSGLSFSFTDTNGVPLTQITPVISTSQASITTNILLWVNANNVAEGTYLFSLNTGGAASDTLLLTLQVAHIWSGADFLSGGSANFSDPANWIGGVPGAADDVVIPDAGGLTGGSTTTNIVVSANTEIASFRQAITVGTNSQDNIELDPGVTLAVTGTNGFSAGLRDHSDTYQKWQLTFVGADSSLVVSNQNADFNTFAIENQTPLLDMSGLGTFVADLYQMHFDDYLAYPNYDNMNDNGYANGSGGAALPRRLPVPQVNWARTNLVHLNFPGDPDNWTNAGLHEYSMIVGNDSGRSSSTQRHHFWFGILNVLEMNSVCFAGSGVAMDQTSGSAGFNSAFATNNPIAIFRGPDGMTNRMAMFAIADNSGVDSSSGSSKAIVNFTGGAVDALVDRLYVGIDRTNCNGGFSRGELDLGAGTFDVNDVILGDQANGNNSGNGGDYCQGVLTLTNGLFRVNDAIDLGYTTADATNNNDAAGAGYGQITVSGGGTIEANVIRLGGVTQLSGDNTITINGGSLIVSNTIAAPTNYLANLTVENGGTLGLFVNGTNTTPCVFATNLVTSGTASIAIEGIANLTPPEEVPLIQYAAGTPTLSVTVPAGYSAAIIDHGAGSTIDAYITAGSPKSLAWRGYLNNNWNTTDKNWLDLNTGLHTNFAQLDDVTFDDTVGVPTNINLAAQNLIPGAIIVTDNTQNYILSGSGSLTGSATVTKSGSGTLDIESFTTLGVDVNQGSLTNSVTGTIFSASVATGGSIFNAGTISGNVACGGLGINAGTIGGSLAVETGGVVTNLNTVNGPFTVQTNAFLNNYSSGSITYPAGFTSTVDAGGGMLNLGSINGDLMNVYGTLEDNSSSGITIDRLTIEPGAQYIPGGDGIGITYVLPTSIPGLTYPGRLSLSAGSTTLIKVDPGAGQPNTIVGSGFMDIGPSEKYQTQNGCTLAITNIGATPFAAGQVFSIFKGDLGGPNPAYLANPNPDGTSTNAFPIIQPASPGPGLSWDLSHIWMPDNSGNWGEIGIIGTPAVTLTNSFVVSAGKVVANLSWASAQLGYVLEEQTVAPGVGITTNWVRVNGTTAETALSVTNALGTNDMFFRLVYP